MKRCPKCGTRHPANTCREGGPRKRPPEYLCQYGDCPERLAVKKSYIVGKPDGMGAPRYCTAEHALLGLARVVGVHEDVEALLRTKGLLK